MRENIKQDGCKHGDQTRMSALMSLQISFLDKLLRAVWALMPLVPGVQALVCFEIPELAETLPAVLTLERFLSGVDAHVCLQVADLAEPLLARPADVGLGEQRILGLELVLAQRPALIVGGGVVGNKVAIDSQHAIE